MHVSYVLTKPLLGKEVGEVVQLDQADAQPLVDAGYLAEATADDLNGGGGEDVEEVDAPEAVSNAAKAVGKEAVDAVEKATRIIAEKMAKQVSAPVISHRVPAEAVDKTWGFSSIGDFAKCVVSGQSGNLSAARRIEAAQKSYGRSKDAGYSTGGGPSISTSDGGVLIPPAYTASLFEKVKNVTNLWDFCTEYPFQNTTEFPLDNETGFNSGIKSYWQTEDTTVTQTKPVTALGEIKAKTLMTLVPVTEQLLQDNAFALDAFIGRKVPQKMVDQMNLNLLYGSGGGAGVLSHAATIIVTRGTSSRISFADVNNMYARLHTDNLPNACWFISPSYFPELQRMAFPDTTGTVPMYANTSSGYPNISGPVLGTLHGLPVVPCHALQALGAKGDILLADLSAVAKVQKSIDSAVSMHFYFDRYTNLLRFVIRGNTASQWLTTYTRMDTITASPYVVLSGSSISVPTIS